MMKAWLVANNSTANAARTVRLPGKFAAANSIPNMSICASVTEELKKRLGRIKDEKESAPHQRIGQKAQGDPGQVARPLCTTPREDTREDRPDEQHRQNGRSRRREIVRQCRLEETRRCPQKRYGCRRSHAVEQPVQHEQIEHVRAMVGLRDIVDQHTEVGGAFRMLPRCQEGTGKALENDESERTDERMRRDPPAMPPIQAALHQQVDDGYDDQKTGHHLVHAGQQEDAGQEDRSARRPFRAQPQIGRAAGSRPACR